MIKWKSCQDEMPGQKYDYVLCNKATSEEFIICYHHGDNVDTFAIANLVGGKFELSSCYHYLNENVDGDMDEKLDELKKHYWQNQEKITITHWAHINWPDINKEGLLI